MGTSKGSKRGNTFFAPKSVQHPHSVSQYKVIIIHGVFRYDFVKDTELFFKRPFNKPGA